MLEVDDKVAVVFGGNGGIGKHAVDELLKNGVKGVVIADINDTGIIPSFEAVYGKEKAVFVEVDVSNVEDIKKAYDSCIKKYGAIDIVINCAAIVNEANCVATITINLIGSMQVVNEAYKYLPKHKSSSSEQGVIVNVASVAGLAPFAIFPVYSSAKAGLVAFSHGISKLKELQGDFSVKLITLCPCATNTSMLDYGRKMCHKTTGETQKAVIEVFQKTLPQKPESAAKCILQIIRNGNNGSFWLSKDDKDATLIDYDAIYALALSTFVD